MKIRSIDNGNSFDFGKTSESYAKYRDIYPQEFYDKILSLGLCKSGQTVLDIGTGTGVLPRNMYKYGAHWVGTDLSENQIEQAKILAEKSEMDIDFIACPAEKIKFPNNSFDVVTACQCIWYPDHKKLAPKLARVLKPNGKFLILYMDWLSYKDKIAKLSEDITLKYNPKWTGAGHTMSPVWIPEQYNKYFDITLQEEFEVDVPFTRDSWHGRMRACRGVEASMDKETLSMWDQEHRIMLLENAPEKFNVCHFISIAELTSK